MLLIRHAMTIYKVSKYGILKITEIIQTWRGHRVV